MNSPQSKPLLGKDHFAAIETRPVKATFDPNLSVPAQLGDRIHTISTPATPVSPTFSVADLIAAGATFEEFTICDSGTPASRWIPTWTSDPTP